MKSNWYLTKLCKNGLDSEGNTTRKGREGMLQPKYNSTGHQQNKPTYAGFLSYHCNTLDYFLLLTAMPCSY